MVDTSWWRRGIAATAALALGVGIIQGIAAPALAASDHLLINEVYARGGSANQPYANKFIELRNPTGAAITVDGLSLQYRSSTGTGVANGVVALTGSIAPGGYWVLGLGSNGSTGAALPTPDQTSTAINPSGTTGTLYLARTTSAVTPDDASVVDRVGYGSSNAPEVAPVSYTGSNSTPGSIGRLSDTDTDNNSVDFAFAESVTPGAANDGSTGPTDPTEPPTATAATIAEIQGSGPSSPLAGQVVSTIGVVTANYPTGGFNGFYLQTPGSGGSPKAATDASDGVFVYGSTDVTVGQCYAVTATVTEFNGLTELTKPTLSAQADCAPVAVTALATLPATDAEKEAYEGMLVQPQGSYTITNNYALNQYGQLGLAVGDAPLYTATDVVAPNQAAAFEAEQVKKYITLDDGSSWDYLRSPDAQKSPLPYLSQATPMRTGSQVSFSEPVILDYRFQWNYQPLSQVVGADQQFLTAENDRPTSAPQVGGDVKLASFNVLNYFPDLGKDEQGCRAYTDMYGTPVGANGCQVRGAYSEQAFLDQQTKIVNAINGSGADLVGLMEIETSSMVTWAGKDRDAAVRQLVAALNTARPTSSSKKNPKLAGQWAYVPSPVVTPSNEDVIRTAFIYRTDKVQPIDPSQILLDDAFANARYPLAQKFKVRNSGVSFVAVANHFKSKGSGEDDGTGQGLSNPSRIAQSKALTGWVNELYADQAVFLLGDFNAYSKEDPVRIIEQAGFANLVAPAADGSHATYQFSGRLGSLDHVFGNAAAQKLVTGAKVWNINGDESVAMQYSRRLYNVVDFITAEPFGASDHDPAIVGISGTVTKGSKPRR